MRAITAIALLLLALAPVAQAGFDERTWNVATGQQTVHLTISYPDRVPTDSTTFRVVATYLGPPVNQLVTGSTSSTATWNTLTVQTGCSFSAQNQGGGDTSAGADYWVLETVTMTSNHCDGALSLTLVANPSSTQILSIFLFPFHVDSMTVTNDQAIHLCAAGTIGSTCTTPTVNVAQSGTWSVDNTNRLCAASALGASCTTPTTNVDATNRLCAASAIGTSCTTPTVNLGGTLAVSQSGTWTVTNAGGQTMTLAGSATLTNHNDGTLTVTNAGGQTVTVAGSLNVDALNRLCNASAQGTSCTTPTIAQAQSGAWTVTNAGGQTMTLAGSATITNHNDGTLTVTNAGGQTMTLAGSANVALSGDLNTHQDEACGRTVSCLENQTIIATVNGNTTTPNRLDVSAHFPMGDIADWVPVMIWVIALIWCLRRSKLLASAIATMGAAINFVPGLPQWMLLMPIGAFVISLWLEAVIMDRVYTRFFQNQPDRRPPE